MNFLPFLIRSSKIVFLVGILILGFVSCDKNPFCINGEGDLVTRTLSLSTFSSIDLANSATVIITQGSTQEVIVTGQQNIIDKLKKTISGTHWVIDFEDNACYNYDELTILITIPTLNAAHLSGSGKITINTFTNQNDFSTNISGSGDLAITSFSHQGNLDVGISGSGSVELGQLVGTQDVIIGVSGSGNIRANSDITDVNTTKIKISGSGSVKCFPILADAAIVDISGSGTCEIFAANSLNVSISGSGNVYYKGIPTIVQSISGSGSAINSN